MKLSKELAKKLYNGTEEDLKQFALDNYPELGRPKLEIGKWYKVDRGFEQSGYSPSLVYFQGRKTSAYGFGHGGKWTTNYGGDSTWTNKTYEITLATDKEVEEALINYLEKQLGY